MTVAAPGVYSLVFESFGGVCFGFGVGFFLVFCFVGWGFFFSA